MEGGRMLSVKEVADRIGRSSTTVRTLIKKEKLLATNVGTGRYKSWSVPEEALIEFMKAGESTAILRMKTR